jgi:thiopeptide-type bacteriocin biosynthesis protein
MVRDFELASYRPETGRFGSGPTLEAAEAFFAADSAVAVAALRTDRDPRALVAAGYRDLAVTLAEDGDLALLQHIGHEPGPRLDRALLDEAKLPLPVTALVLESRRSAFRKCAAELDAQETHILLADVLHLHHARLIGIDPASERLCLRLARALAQERTARRALADGAP